jgi:cell division protein FtsN
MKYLSLSILLFIFNIGIYAQSKPSISKENIKRIKAELKNYLDNPELYIQEQETMQSKCRNAEKELNALKSGLRVEQRDLEYARDSVNQMMSELETLRRKQEQADATPPPVIAATPIENVDTLGILKRFKLKPKVIEKIVEKIVEVPMASNGGGAANPAVDCGTNMPDQGTFYKVQIGNFSTFVPSGFEGLKLLIAEKGPKSTRYMVNYFNSKNEALRFIKDIKKLGVRDAFISQYIDGARNEKYDQLKDK